MKKETAPADKTAGVRTVYTYCWELFAFAGRIKHYELTPQPEQLCRLTARLQGLAPTWGSALRGVCRFAETC